MGCSSGSSKRTKHQLLQSFQPKLRRQWVLHNDDIVFGDLRSNNILYVASEHRMVLVHFNWAGKNG